MKQLKKLKTPAKRKKKRKNKKLDKEQSIFDRKRIGGKQQKNEKPTYKT